MEETLGTNCYYSNVLFYGANAKTCPIVAPTPSFVIPRILQHATPHHFNSPVGGPQPPYRCSGYEKDIQCGQVYTQENPSGVANPVFPSPK